MPKKDRKPKARSSGDKWFVYIVRCSDGTLYTGITKDVARRCQQHNAGTASRYTRSRRPVAFMKAIEFIQNALRWNWLV
jgi:putative endonuclease